LRRDVIAPKVPKERPDKLAQLMIVAIGVVKIAVRPRGDKTESVAEVENA
jgi:hypothetical protein